MPPLAQPDFASWPTMHRWTRHLIPILLATHVFLCAFAFPVTPGEQFVLSSARAHDRKDTKVLILGGGVAGVIAARTLHKQGVDDFIIVEARPELGGRLMSHEFGADGKKWTVEVGANWVQGTQTEGGAANPIWELAKKHNVSFHSSDYFGNMCMLSEMLLHEYQGSLPCHQRHTMIRVHMTSKTSFSSRSRTSES